MSGFGGLSIAQLLINVQQLAPDLSGQCVQGHEYKVTQFASLTDAGAADIAFLANDKYAKQLIGTLAGAIVLTPAAYEAHKEALLDKAVNQAVITSDNPYAFFAFASQCLQGAKTQAVSTHSTISIHPTAMISATAKLAVGVRVGAYAVIEDGAVVGQDCHIGSHCVIGENSIVGAATYLYPHVTVYHGVQLGENCIVHSGTVIGADGFGFAPYKKRWVKIPQTGTVLIGDDVELGSNCSIDRGALGNTTIGRGTKLDNLIQIAHNVQVGEDCAFAANIAIAGSAVIGNRVQMGGKAGVLGHLSVCDDVVISSCTLVTKTIAKPGFYTGVYPMQDNAEWEKNAVSLKRLNTLREHVKALERQVQQLQASHLAPSNAA